MIRFDRRRMLVLFLVLVVISACAFASDIGNDENYYVLAGDEYTPTRYMVTTRYDLPSPIYTRTQRVYLSSNYTYFLRVVVESRDPIAILVGSVFLSCTLHNPTVRTGQTLVRSFSGWGQAELQFKPTSSRWYNVVSSAPTAPLGCLATLHVGTTSKGAPHPFWGP